MAVPAVQVNGNAAPKTVVDRAVALEAYALFEKNASLPQVCQQLKLTAEEVLPLHQGYLKMINREKIVALCNEIGDSESEALLKDVRACKAQNITFQWLLQQALPVSKLEINKGLLTRSIAELNRQFQDLTRRTKEASIQYEEKAYKLSIVEERLPGATTSLEITNAELNEKREQVQAKKVELSNLTKKIGEGNALFVNNSRKLADEARKIIIGEARNLLANTDQGWMLFLRALRLAMITNADVLKPFIYELHEGRVHLYCPPLLPHMEIKILRAHYRVVLSNIVPIAESELLNSHKHLMPNNL